MDLVGYDEGAVPVAYLCDRNEVFAAPDIASGVVRGAEYHHFHGSFGGQQAVQTIEVHLSVLQGVAQHYAAVALRHVGERMVDGRLHYYLVAGLGEEVYGKSDAPYDAGNEAYPVALYLPAVLLEEPVLYGWLHLGRLGIIAVDARVDIFFKFCAYTLRRAELHVGYPERGDVLSAEQSLKSLIFD